MPQYLRSYGDKLEAIQRYRGEAPGRKVKLRSGGFRTYRVTLPLEAGNVEFRLTPDEVSALFIEYPGTTELWQVFEQTAISRT